MSVAPDLADRIDEAFAPISGAVNDVVFYSVPLFGRDVPVVVIWLFSAGIVLTFALRFVNLRGFGYALSLVAGRTDRSGAAGEISHFQALASALSGTVGLGNIASVPVAICLGGPGAIFWMIVAAFFGMTTKFAECSLAVKYRRIGRAGRVIGGPMFYIETALARRGLKTVGKVAAVFFAVMAMGGALSFFQVNQSYAQVASVTGLAAPLGYGVVMCGLVAVVTLTGIRGIGRVTGVLVPAMAGVYIVAGLTIVGLNIDAVPGAIGEILRGAFGLDAAAGGFAGALINGVQRATYSSEAGVGSSAIAHAAVRTDEPLTEGYVALLEPFVDTIVVCLVTGLVIVTSGVHRPFVGAAPADIVGIELTSAAFAGAFSWYPYVLMVSVVLFAFSTLISWAYYGSQAAAYLFGDRRVVDVTFKLALCALLSVGAAVSLSSIVDFIDAMLFGMCIPNLVAIYLLLPELRGDLRAFEAKRAA